MPKSKICAQTRQESLEKLEPAKRKQDIITVLKTAKRPLTAREIKDWMEGLELLEQGSDMNGVRPRLTDLEAEGYVIVVGKKNDYKTGRPVAIYALAPANDEGQMRLF